MKIEQIQYFVEVARKGSITSAAKGLFISPQGLSESIQQLENFLGFPLFVRQNKGVSLTSNGEKLLEPAQLLLESYKDLIFLSRKLEYDFNRNTERTFLLINPIFFKALLDILSSNNMLDRFNLLESGIALSIQQLQNRFATMAIMVIMNEDIIGFEKSLSNDLGTIKLFEDEFGVCTLAGSPYSDLQEVDDTDSSILFIEQPSSYYEYFNMALGAPTSIKTSDTFTHIKLMKENNAVCVCAQKLMNLTYPGEDLIFIPFKKKRRGQFYLVYNNSIDDKGLENLRNQVIDVINKTFRESK